MQPVSQSASQPQPNSGRYSTWPEQPERQGMHYYLRQNLEQRF